MGTCAPRAGLTRRKGGQMPAKAAGGLRGGFVPPFVRKALNSGSGNDEKPESPLSAKTLQLLAGRWHRKKQKWSAQQPMTILANCGPLMQGKHPGMPVLFWLLVNLRSQMSGNQNAILMAIVAPSRDEKGFQTY